MASGGGRPGAVRRPDRVYFLALPARKAFAQPGMSACRPRANASASGSTSRVMTEPEPTKAPSPIYTGATSAELEPMKAPAPMSVLNLEKPS